MTADSHCVTTWTRTGLRWGGYRLTDVLEKLVLPRCRPQARARYLAFTSLDGYRMCIDRRDVHADILLADRLDGAPLSIEPVPPPIRLQEPEAPLRHRIPAGFGGVEPSARHSPILADVSRMRSGVISARHRLSLCLSRAHSDDARDLRAGRGASSHNSSLRDAHRGNRRQVRGEHRPALAAVC